MSEDVHVVARSTPPCLSAYLEDPGSNEDCMRTKLDPGKTQKKSKSTKFYFQGVKLPCLLQVFYIEKPCQEEW